LKILVLGGTGMAGHMIVQYFQMKTDFEVRYTTRTRNNGIYFNATEPTTIEEIIRKYRPDVVINVIGLLNEQAATNQMDAILVNSYLPHFLQKVLDEYGGKLIHISTDCVFSGVVDKNFDSRTNGSGRYSENDKPDGTSVYAMTKTLGEIWSYHHVTLRTSIIGPELKDGIGLFHWFMTQKGQINGYQKVLWNGITTLQLAKVIETVIEKDGAGLFHVTAPEIISKYDLLKQIQRIFSKKDVTIHPDNEILLDRTLKYTRTDLVFRVPNYEKMLTELHEWMERHG